MVFCNLCPFKPFKSPCWRAADNLPITLSFLGPLTLNMAKMCLFSSPFWINIITIWSCVSLCYSLLLLSLLSKRQESTKPILDLNLGHNKVRCFKHRNQFCIIRGGIQQWKQKEKPSQNLTSHWTLPMDISEAGMKSMKCWVPIFREDSKSAVIKARRLNHSRESGAFLP